MLRIDAKKFPEVAKLLLDQMAEFTGLPMQDESFETLYHFENNRTQQRGDIKDDGSSVIYELETFDSSGSYDGHLPILTVENYDTLIN